MPATLSFKPPPHIVKEHAEVIRVHFIPLHQHMNGRVADNIVASASRCARSRSQVNSPFGNTSTRVIPACDDDMQRADHDRYIKFDQFVAQKWSL
jgi:hypothetical protein